MQRQQQQSTTCCRLYLGISVVSAPIVASFSIILLFHFYRSAPSEAIKQKQKQNSNNNYEEPDWTLNATVVVF